MSDVEARDDQRSTHGATEELGAWFEEQAIEAIGRARRLWSSSWILTGIGLVMNVVGAWVLWSVGFAAFEDLKRVSASERDSVGRLLGPFTYPAIYLVTVWFAPASMALVCGSCLRSAAHVLRSTAKQFGFLAVAGPGWVYSQGERDPNMLDRVRALGLSPKEGAMKRLADLVSD